MGNAIIDYSMIEGDVVMACIDGGKDSFAMLDILLNLQKAAPINLLTLSRLTLIKSNLDFLSIFCQEYFQSLNIPYYIVDKDNLFCC